MKPLLTALALALCGLAQADTSVGPITYGSAPLKRGNTTVATINPATEQNCTDRAKLDAETRDSTAPYTCGVYAFVVSWVAAPIVCPQTQPADKSLTLSCGQPYFGTRPATQVYTLHPSPACWVADGAITPPNDTAPPCLTSPPSGTYTTTFTAQENPLSEGGAWTHLGTPWPKLKVGPNGAQAAQATTQGYNDAYAHLSGFGPNQSAECTLYVKPGIANGSREVEIHLRWSDDAGNARGLELFWAVNGTYYQAAQWNGGLGDFSMVTGKYATNPVPLKTGDKVRGTISGQAVVMYTNDVEMLKFNWGGYASGNPGLGFYIDPSNAQIDDVACRSFTATQLP